MTEITYWRMNEIILMYNNSSRLKRIFREISYRICGRTCAVNETFFSFVFLKIIIYISSHTRGILNNPLIHVNVMFLIQTDRDSEYVSDIKKFFRYSYISMSYSDENV